VRGGGAAGGVGGAWGGGGRVNGVGAAVGGKCGGTWAVGGGVWGGGGVGGRGGGGDCGVGRAAGADGGVGEGRGGGGGRVGGDNILSSLFKSFQQLPRYPLRILSPLSFAITLPFPSSVLLSSDFPPSIVAHLLCLPSPCYSLPLFFPLLSLIASPFHLPLLRSSGGGGREGGGVGRRGWCEGREGGGRGCGCGMGRGGVCCA